MTVEGCTARSPYGAKRNTGEVIPDCALMSHVKLEGATSPASPRFRGRWSMRWSRNGGGEALRRRWSSS